MKSKLLNKNLNNESICIINSKTLIVFIYLKFILSMVTLFLVEDYINILTIFFTVLIFLNLLYKNKFKICAIFLISMLSIALLYIFNLFFVTNKNVILAQLLDFLSYNIIVAYTITCGIDYKFLLEYWYKLACKINIALIIFILLGLTKNVGYMYIGIYNAYNSIIISYYMLNKNQKKIKNCFLFFITVVIALFYSNRSSLITVLFGFCYGLFCYLKKRTLKKFIFYIICIFIIFLIICFFDNILNLMLSVLERMDINTYSINKYIRMLKGEFWEMSSGRDVLYKVASDAIIESNGLPLGVGYFNKATSGEFNYPHNFILEWYVVFGYILGSIFLFILLVLIALYYTKNKKNKEKIVVFSIFLLYFITRTMFSSTFLKERSFWVVIFMIISFIFNVNSKPAIEENNVC